MQPKIISKKALHIAGLTGDGSKTGEVWGEFDSRYDAAPFEKSDDDGYEIRFWPSRVTGKTPEPDKGVHVGFLTENAANAGGFETVILPAAEYAVWDVYVAKGYDSANEDMERWLADNAQTWRMLEFDGMEYVVECYNEKFKGGDKEDSAVEIWIAVAKII